MSDLTERVARALCSSTEEADFDALPVRSIVRAAYVQQARAAIRETVRAFVEETYTDLDPTFAENFLRKHGIEP